MPHPPHRRTVPLALLLACLAAAGLEVAAQQAETEPPELVTDRPDASESAQTVAPGFVQVETGATYTRDDEDGTVFEQREVPGTLVRIGWTDRLELRLGWTGHVDQEVESAAGTADAAGLGDGEVGFKLALWPEEGARPAVALLLSTSLPLGETEVSSDAFDPELRLALEHTLSERWGLSYNVGLAWETEETGGGEHQLSTGFYTVTLGLGLGERWGTYFELFGEVAASAESDSPVAFSSGLTYLARPNLQLDVAAGVGLNEAADDYFVGVGLSIRLPR